MFLINLRRFRAPLEAESGETGKIAVLIPARNEEGNIGEALRCVLVSRDVDLEVLVYDDSSTDATASIVSKYAARDARVRLVEGSALPQGWNGKQHACWRLAEASAAPLLLFLDADVRLEPEAIRCCIAQLGMSRVKLLSGFPRLITVTWMEWLVLPLIQFVLLGFLPIGRMRRTTIPAYAAGCGQFMMCERETYFACGGHAAIRETRHDGLRLPHLFRERGFRTDICDLTELASVRMYSSASDVWNGLAKNATEGLGSPGKIAPLSLLLLVGQVAPLLVMLYIVAVLLILLPMIWLHHMFIIGVSSPMAFAFSTALPVCVVAIYVPRLLSFRRFKQPLRSALLHPVGIVVLLAIQWYALVRRVMGKSVGWRARTYAE